MPKTNLCLLNSRNSDLICLNWLSQASILLLLILLPRALLGLDPPITISSTGRDSLPELAFDTQDQTWLVVWREQDANFSSAGRVMGRILGAVGNFLSQPFQIVQSLDGMSAPRVDYDDGK